MKQYNLKDFTNGWIIGNFSPAIYKNENLEIAIKFFKLGEREDYYMQLKATEITVVVKGEIEINNKTFIEGSIIEVPPNEPANLNCLKDSILICVKYPSLPNDKVACK